MNEASYNNTGVSLSGIPELMKALERALLKHSVNDVRKSLTRGALVLVDEAKRNVSVNDGGRLQNSIKILPKFNRDPATLYVGPKVIRRFTKKTSQKAKDANPFYAHFTEYGTDPHNLGYKGKYVSVKGADHPGARKQPYMRPAYDTKAQEAINVAMEDLEKMIVS